MTYSAGINGTFLCTTHQDYWAGEFVVYQDGTIADSSVDQLHRLDRALRFAE